MPRLTTPPDRSTADPGLRVRRRSAATVAFAAAAVFAACNAATGPPTIPPMPSTVMPRATSTLATVTLSGSAVDGPGGAGPPPGSPRLDVEPVEPARLATVTLICERWGSGPPASLVSCGDAARLALARLGASAVAVTRLDVGYGEWCDALTGPCGDRSAGAVWVVARSGDLETSRLRVARMDSGELAVWPPVPGPTVEPVPFDPPARRAPPLGDDAPPDLARREAFPLCGDEELGASEAFATAARRCFLSAVLAASRAELDSHATSTEGDAVLTVYRFGGSGAIRRWVRSARSWSASACGIAPLDTPAVFEMAGVCVTVPP